MKELKLFAKQKWRTFEVDPLLITPIARRKAAQYAHRKGGVLIFPGPPGSQDLIHSSDPRVIRLKVETARVFTEKYPMKVQDNVAAANAVIGNFYAARTDNAPPRRAIPPLPNNNIFRQEEKLADSWQHPAHRELCQELAREMFREWRPGSIKFAKHSVSGFPFFTYDVGVKIGHFGHLIANVESVLKKVAQDDLTGLLRDHNLVIAGRQAARWQADKWELTPTPHCDGRRVPDLAFALTDGQEGAVSHVDNSTPTSDQLVAMRHRAIYGVANPVNSLMAAFVEPFNEAIFHNFRATFSTHGPQDIEERCSRWKHHLAIDVSNHDLLAADFIIDEMFNALPLDPRVVKLIKMAWRCPMMVPWPDLTADHPPIMIGHPLDPTCFNQNYGVLSGHQLVSLAGKFGCVTVYLCDLFDAGVDLRGRVGAWLKWETEESAILDTGDDAVFCTNSAAIRERFATALEKRTYYKTGPQVLSYLGFVFAKDETIANRFKVVHSPLAYVINPLTIERSIGSALSPFWAQGHFNREMDFLDTPGIENLRDTRLKLFRDIMGYDLERAIRAHPNYNLRPPILAPDDNEILMRPEKLYYRPDLQASPEVESRFVSKVEPSLYVEAIMPYVHAERIDY